MCLLRGAAAACDLHYRMAAGLIGSDVDEPLLTQLTEAPSLGSLIDRWASISEEVIAIVDARMKQLENLTRNKNGGMGSHPAGNGF